MNTGKFGENWKQTSSSEKVKTNGSNQWLKIASLVVLELVFIAHPCANILFVLFFFFINVLFCLDFRCWFYWFWCSVFFARLLLILENIPSARKLEHKSPLAHFHLCCYSRYYASFNLYLCFFSLQLSLDLSFVRSFARSFTRS